MTHDLIMPVWHLNVTLTSHVNKYGGGHVMKTSDVVCKQIRRMT